MSKASSILGIAFCLVVFWICHPIVFFLLLQKARRVDTLCDEIIEFSLPDILFMATRVINMRKYHILSGDFFGHLSLVVTGTFKVFQTLGRFQESLPKTLFHSTNQL